MFNFASHLKSGKEDWAAIWFSFLFKKWEGGLGDHLMFLLAYKEWVGESNGHLILLLAYKWKKGNPNAQNSIKVNYQSNLINVN
jgi:hypothetical protein